MMFNFMPVGSTNFNVRCIKVQTVCFPLITIFLGIIDKALLHLKNTLALMDPDRVSCLLFRAYHISKNNVNSYSH